MDKYIKKLNEIGASYIDKNCEINGIVLDYIGYNIEGEPIIALDKNEKQTSHLINLGKSIKYYGTYTNDWTIYKITGGRIEPLQNMPRLDKELKKELHNWFNNIKEYVKTKKDRPPGTLLATFYANIAGEFIKDQSAEVKTLINKTSEIKPNINISQISGEVIVNELDIFLEKSGETIVNEIEVIPTIINDFILDLMKEIVQDKKNVLDGLARDGKFLTSIKHFNADLNTYGFNKQQILNDCFALRSMILDQNNNIFTEEILNLPIIDINIPPQSIDLIFTDIPTNLIKKRKIDLKQYLTSPEKYDDYQVQLIDVYKSLLKDDGYIFIIVSSNILRTKKYQIFREYLTDNFAIKGIIDLPKDIINYDKSLLIMSKQKQPDHVFMAVPKTENDFDKVVKDWRSYNAK